MSLGKGFEKGQRIGGRYELLSVLGKGRSATIFRASDSQTRSEVALKILDPFLVQDPTNVERFRREATLIRSLSHPNIIKVYDLIQTENSYAIVMEFFDGKNLRIALDERRSFTVAEFLQAAKAIAGAIEACHGARVLHRDLKPQNILINGDGEIKVVDFGISKMNSMSDLTKTGTFLGTPEYMAPELFTSPLSDPRIDIYGLGAVLFEMLYGRSPYAGLSIQQVMAKQATDQIPSIREKRDDVPEWLEAIIAKCLRRSADQRFQSVYDLRADLEKGERSVALAESRRDRICCWECKQDLVAGLPFCHGCGQWMNNLSEPGRYSVVIYDLTEGDKLLKHTESRLGLQLANSARSLLKRRPFVYVRNVAEPASKAIYHSLSDVAVRAMVHERLSSELKLPMRFVWAECLLLSPVLANMVWPNVLSSWVLFPLVYTVVSQGPIVWLFLRQTRCLTRSQRRGRKTDSSASLLLSEWHGRMMAVGSARMRMLLAQQLRTLSLILEKDRNANRLREGIKASFAAAERLSEFESFLSSTTLNAIKENTRSVELKIRVTKDPEELEKLIRKKAWLEQSFRNYIEIQQHHSELYLALLNFQTVLSQYLVAVEEQAEVGLIAAQYDKICLELWDGASEKETLKISAIEKRRV